MGIFGSIWGGVKDAAGWVGDTVGGAADAYAGNTHTDFTPYDVNESNYERAGAQTDINRYQGLAGAADARTAPSVYTDAYAADRQRELESRAQQQMGLASVNSALNASRTASDYGAAGVGYAREGIDAQRFGLGAGRDAIGYMQDAAAGRGPSVAELQMRRGLNQGMGQIASTAASARGGGANLAAAQQEALRQSANLYGNVTAQAAELRAQEMMQARAGLAGAAASYNGQGAQLGTGFNAAAANAGNLAAGYGNAAQGYMGAVSGIRAQDAARTGTSAQMGQAAATTYLNSQQANDARNQFYEQQATHTADQQQAGSQQAEGANKDAYQFSKTGVAKQDAANATATSGAIKDVIGMVRDSASDERVKQGIQPLTGNITASPLAQGSGLAGVGNPKALEMAGAVRAGDEANAKIYAAKRMYGSGDTGWGDIAYGDKAVFEQNAGGGSSLMGGNVGSDAGPMGALSDANSKQEIESLRAQLAEAKKPRGIGGLFSTMLHGTQKANGLDMSSQGIALRDGYEEKKNAADARMTDWYAPAEAKRAADARMANVPMGLHRDEPSTTIPGGRIEMPRALDPREQALRDEVARERSGGGGLSSITNDEATFVRSDAHSKQAIERLGEENAVLKSTLKRFTLPTGDGGYGYVPGAKEYMADQMEDPVIRKRIMANQERSRIADETARVNKYAADHRVPEAGFKADEPPPGFRVANREADPPKITGHEPGLVAAAKAPPAQFLDSIKPYAFNYKPGVAGERPDERRYGVMAQDVEKTPMGASMVEETPQGKALNIKHGFGVTLASLANINERMRALETGRGGR